MKISCAAPGTFLGECQKNRELIQSEINLCSKEHVTVLVLPALCITGYTCGQLFTFPFFIKEQWAAIKALDVPSGIICVTSVMTEDGEKPYAFGNEGEIKQAYFHELGLHLCSSVEETTDKYWNLLPFSHQWTVCSIDKLVNRLKHKKVAFASCGKGESTAKKVFSGICGAIQQEKVLLKQNDRVLFDLDDSDDFKPIAPVNVFDDQKLPFVPTQDAYLHEAIDILSAALRRRLDHLGSDKVVLGISGGLDSTLSLLLCHQTIPHKQDIVGMTLPGFGTSDRTKKNAEILMEKLGVQSLKISIGDAVKNHLNEIGHPLDQQDVVYENAQARERMQILFDYANQVRGIVVGSSDMSEAMLGFTTFGGDNMSMYNPIGGVPKTLVRSLLQYLIKRYPDCDELLADIIDTPISPELLPGSQCTEEILGEYLYHDFYMYHTVVNRMGREEISELFQATFGKPAEYLDEFYRRMVAAQFKRNCSPDSPQLLSINLSRKYFNLPSDIKNIF